MSDIERIWRSQIQKRIGCESAYLLWHEWFIMVWKKPDEEELKERREWE